MLVVLDICNVLLSVLSSKLLYKLLESFWYNRDLVLTHNHALSISELDLVVPFVLSYIFGRYPCLRVSV